jgi:hypothetical protein
MSDVPIRDAAPVETEDMRALVGAMLGDEQIRTLDDGGLRVLSSLLFERMMFARQDGLSFNGARDLYSVLGYNRIVTYADYRARYLRGGLAKRVVDAYPMAVWRGGAEVYEDEDPDTETPFEEDWKKLDQRLGLWSRLQRAHVLAGLSTYSVLLLGDGESNMTLPLRRGTGPDSLIYMQPYSAEGGPGPSQNRDGRVRSMTADVTIGTYDTNPSSPRFGMVDTYQLRRINPISVLPSFPHIHWSRVIHVANGLLADEVFGTPELESVWNLFDDLYKVTGGGAEAFWLRANQGLHLDVDKTMALAPGAPVVQGSKALPGIDEAAQKALRERAEELKHQLQRVMVTRGVTATQLGSDVANFRDPADAIITQIAGTKGIPKRILIGSEMGQLASGQDKDNWNTQVQDKRTSWAFPAVVKQLLDRLVQFGYIRPPKNVDDVAVEWPVIEDLTEDEKVKLTLDMANVNKTQEAIVYTEEEMRAVTKRDPLDDAIESDQLSETQKAEVAVKLTMANKQMGLTVFTDDEIRKITYGYDPLPDSEKVPIETPEKVSVTQPPKLGEEGAPVEQTGQDVAPALPLKAALAALEEAIENDDLAAIGKIVGIDAR